MKNFIKGKLRSHNDGAFPVSVSHGMHVETGRARTIYIIMLSVMPLLGLFGSVFTFITACESKGVVIISKSFAAWITLGAYLLLGDIRAEEEVSCPVTGAVGGGCGRSRYLCSDKVSAHRPWIPVYHKRIYECGFFKV